MQSFHDIIAIWPKPDDLAEDIGEKAATVRKWDQRNSIPAPKWVVVAEAAHKRGHMLSYEQLAKIAALAVRQ